MSGMMTNLHRSSLICGLCILFASHTFTGVHCAPTECGYKKWFMENSLFLHFSRVVSLLAVSGWEKEWSVILIKTKLI